MKLTFQTGRTYRANILEHGDKFDQSVVHLLSTLPSESFLVEKKAGAWVVITGVVSVSRGDPVLGSQDVVNETVAKPKDEKPKEKPQKKKKEKVLYASRKK